jgi:large subunit ribosomal protein L29
VKKTLFLEEMRRLGPEELRARREAMERDALSLRLQLGGAALKNFRAVREMRRNMARLDTVLREKIAAADDGGKA